jgi:hypothetical protein
MKNLILSLLIAGVQPIFAYSQPGRNANERADDRHQIHRDEATLARDRIELNGFRALERKMDDGIKNLNREAAVSAYSDLVAAMEREVSQGLANIEQAEREISQSRTEVHTDTREVNRDKRQGKPVQAADDRHDRRDDQRDLEDDKRDLAELKARHNRQKEILNACKAIEVKNAPNPVEAIQAKRNLINEFEHTMSRDIGEKAEETAEDHKEIREDRKETREDKSQR